MLFIEVFRLVLVLLGALTGIEIGHTIDGSPAPVVGMVLGALVGYVVGGILGRLINREEHLAIERFARVPPGELFAGSLTAVAGLLLVGALSIPLLALVHRSFVYPLVTAVGWVAASMAYRVGASKGRQVAAAAGLSRILAPPTEPPPGYALLVDVSALLDRSLLVLGRSGLLVGGLVVPRFVIDQVRALAATPDPSGSRRARRGLESIEALRELGVAIHVADNELPEIDKLDDRILEMARKLRLRLATCSPRLYEQARRRGIAATDLRKMVGDLSPDYPPGEILVLDLVKAGNQARQAVGFLPDGDMVVVNDASHLIGHDHVAVEVLTTRSTSQGLLVFGRLAQRGGTGRSTPAGGTAAGAPGAPVTAEADGAEPAGAEPAGEAGGSGAEPAGEAGGSGAEPPRAGPAGAGRGILRPRTRVEG